MSKNNGNGAGPMLTPLAEWQRLRVHGAVMTLRSTGRVVKWRPVELIRALQQGKIPDHLTAFVAARTWSGSGVDERSDKEKAVEWLDYLDMMATLALIDPDPASLEPGDLLYEELVEIEETVRNPAKAVQPFPGKQSAGVDARPEGSEVHQAAK